MQNGILSKIVAILISAVFGAMTGLLFGYLLGFLVGAHLPRISEGMVYENVMAYMFLLGTAGTLIGPYFCLRWLKNRS